MRNSERQINDFLKKGLKTYFILQRRGRDKLANAVLAFTSSLSNLMLNLSGLRKSYRPIICHQCKRKLTEGKDIKWYKETGECLWCASQHFETEVLPTLGPDNGPWS